MNGREEEEFRRGGSSVDRPRPRILFPLRRRNRYKLREKWIRAGKHCREEVGDGGSLADVISNLLTGTVYEWVRGKVIGSERERERAAKPLFYRVGVPHFKARGGLDLRLTLLKFVLWSRLIIQDELSSGTYTKSFFQYSLYFTLAILP